MPLELDLERFEFDGDPAVRIRVPTQRRDLGSITDQLEEALKLDSGSGLLKRSAFLEACRAHLTSRSRAASAQSSTSSPTSRTGLDADPGLLALEDMLDSAGALLHGQLQPDDVGGRLTARGYAVLLERGNARDLDA